MPNIRSSPRPTFLVVESDAALNRPLARALEEFGPVRATTSFRGATTLLRNVERLLGVVVGHPLGEHDGLEVAARARAVDSSVSILVLSESYEHETIHRAQILGAQYLRRPWGTDNLMAFVRRAVEQRGGPDNLLALLLFDLAQAHRFSDRESELVSLVARGESAADVVDAMGVSANTVKTLTRRVLRKCGAPNLDTLVRPLRQVALGIPERSK